MVDRRQIRCRLCGWTGGKGDLLMIEIEPEFIDWVKAPFYTYGLPIPPEKRLEYRCPHCGKVIASDLHYASSRFDDDSFPE